MASKTIHRRNGYDDSSPLGNHLRFIFPKGSYRAPKLLDLQRSFEQSFADNLRRLKPNDTSDFLSLSWMRQAVDSLFVNHKLMKTLMADVVYPSSLWDEKWIELYLYDSVKLLDVCIALISKVSQLEQQQILLRYALQILDFSCCTSREQLQRAVGALCEWMQKLHMRSPKLETVPAILLSLKEALYFPKVKNSSKRKVLMRAFYAMKVEIIFVYNVLCLVLSGCSKPLMDVEVPNDFPWSNVFNDLQTSINRELKSTPPIALKELDRVESTSRYLHDIISALINRKDESTNEIDGQVVEEARRRCGEPVVGLTNEANRLAAELDLLGWQLNGFFELIMLERDTLLCNMRANEKEK